MARNRGPDAEPPPALGTYGGGLTQLLDRPRQTNPLDIVTIRAEYATQLLDRRANDETQLGESPAGEPLRGPEHVPWDRNLHRSLPRMVPDLPKRGRPGRFDGVQPGQRQEPGRPQGV